MSVIGTGAAILGSAALGGAGNFFGAKEQADARRDAARTANRPFRQKEPFLEDLFESGGEAQQSTQDRLGGLGPFQAPKASEQSIQRRAELGRSLGEQGFGQGVQNLGQELTSPGALDPNQNQFLGNQIDAATQPVMERFREQLIPEINNRAAEVGQFGSSRQGVVEANALDDVTENLANTTQQVISQERQRQLQAPDILSQAAQLRLTPASILESAGQADIDLQSQLNQLEGQERQNIISDEFDGLQQQAQLLGTGPNQISSPGVGPSPVQSALSGAAGGASTAAGVMNALNRADGGGGISAGRPQTLGTQASTQAFNQTQG